MFKNDPKDNLKNRRIIAFIAFFYVISWPFILLAAHLWLGLNYQSSALFLGYAGVFGSSPIVVYFLAAAKEPQ